jgi:hypothetical protein
MKHLHTLVPHFRRFCPECVHAAKTHHHGLLACASVTN